MLGVPGQMWPATEKSLTENPEEGKRRGMGGGRVAGEGAFERDENAQDEILAKVSSFSSIGCVLRGEKQQRAVLPLRFLVAPWEHFTALLPFTSSSFKKHFTASRDRPEGNSPSLESEPRRASGTFLPVLRAATLRGGRPQRGSGGPKPGRGDQSRADTEGVSQ